MAEENNKIPRVRLNRNVLSKNRIYGIPKVNIVEAIIFSIAVWLIILSINFTKLVSSVCILVLCPIVFVCGIKGIKSRSVLQFLLSNIKFVRNRKMLHLRGPEYKRKENQYASQENIDESVVEKIIRLAGEKLRKFIEENSSV